MSRCEGKSFIFYGGPLRLLAGTKRTLIGVLASPRPNNRFHFLKENIFCLANVTLSQRSRQYKTNIR